jgi:hypothetical protein
MKNLTKEQIAQIITDPENRPSQFGKMIWNGNELVFEAYPKHGIAGIAPDMPVELAEEITRRWNKEEVFRPFKTPDLPLQGWVCPRCRVVHAPFVKQCSCDPPTITSGSWLVNDGEGITIKTNSK